MATNGTTTAPTAAEFSATFDRVFGLILEEWPSITVESLKATSGDLEKVSTLVAETSGKTKTLVKRQLGELVRVLDEPSAFRPFLAQVERLQTLVESLEKKSRDLVEVARGELPEARARVEKKVEENLWTSLIIAVGLGFIFGFVTRGGR